MKIFIVCIAVSLSSHIIAQTKISALNILNKSIDFHDPDGQLHSGDYTFQFKESRPDGSSRKTNTRFAPSKDKFDVVSFREGRKITYEIRGKDIKILLDDSSDFSEEEIKNYRLKKERAAMIKNYYLYLWHLPMKLKDPGTIIDSKYKLKTFNNYDCYELKITYEQSVGDDIWYYYFDKNDFQMRGYRFYHDESKNDGEYINIEGLTKYKNIKIPAKRDWYTHKHDKFLGSDQLVEISKN